MGSLYGLIFEVGDEFKGISLPDCFQFLLFRGKIRTGHYLAVGMLPVLSPPFSAHELRPRHHEVALWLTYKAKSPMFHSPTSAFLSRQAGAVSVTGEGGRLIGLIAHYDIRLCLQSGRNPFTMSAKEIMNPNPVSFRYEEKAYTALCLMRAHPKPIMGLPVLDQKDRPVGMLRLQDLMPAGLERVRQTFSCQS